MFADATARTTATEATVIDFSARLSERKVGRAKARLRLWAEQAMDEFSQRAFQMRHRDSSINAQALDLKEHRIVGWIGRVATKDSAGRDHSHRCTATLHRMNLHGRGL